MPGASCENLLVGDVGAAQVAGGNVAAADTCRQNQMGHGQKVGSIVQKLATGKASSSGIMRLHMSAGHAQSEATPEREVVEVQLVGCAIGAVIHHLRATAATSVNHTLLQSKAKGHCDRKGAEERWMQECVTPAQRSDAHPSCSAANSRGDLMVPELPCWPFTRCSRHVPVVQQASSSSGSCVRKCKCCSPGQQQGCTGPAGIRRRRPEADPTAH